MSPAKEGLERLEVRVTTRGAPLVQRTRTGLWAAVDEASGRSLTIRQALPKVVAVDDVRRELAREAKVLALLGSHEAVLGLFVDASADEVPRLVLEGGDLTPLSSWLSADRPRELAAALALLIPLAEALAVAHARAIVHAALGPDVVLVTDRGTPKLALWASALAPSLDPPPAVDELRDPTWIAPEVRMGEPPRPSADVFALGSLLALLLRGGADSVQGEPASAFPPPRPGRAAAPSSHLTERTPDAVAKVIARAVAKSPLDRYDDASAFLAALFAASPTVDRRALARRGGKVQEAAAAGGVRGPALAPFLAVLGGLAIWVAGVELATEAPEAPGASEAPVTGGHLRILAHPWASVSLDGEPLDTTPIGAPVAVRPGRHVLDFVHPRAPKVQRVVEVLPGQTVVVDVILDLPVPVEIDAGPESP